MINKIWGSFFIIGILYALMTGNIKIVNEELITSGESVVEIIKVMIPLLVLWMGIMNIAKESGMLYKISHFLKPVFSKLFPDLDEDNPALGYIASNIIINMFGLGSAATPFGLKAMKYLQEENEDKETASRSMITFLVLNTSGVTIVPTTVISLRLLYGSLNPTEIIVTSLLATICSSTFGLIFDRIFYKINGG